MAMGPRNGNQEPETANTTCIRTEWYRNYWNWRVANVDWVGNPGWDKYPVPPAKGKGCFAKGESRNQGVDN